MHICPARENIQLSNLIQITQLRVSGVYDASGSIKLALDDLLERVQEEHSKLFPQAAMLTW